MKKMRILSVLMLVVFMLSSLSVAAYNLEDYLPCDSEVGSAVVKNSTPTVDGSVSTAEGYSDPVVLNYRNMHGLWSASSRCIITADVHFAWDETGLYVGANIVDPTLLLSTGEDDVDNDGENVYGWNGDVFIFAIDPMSACYDIGMSFTGDRTAWYAMSIGEGDKFMCYASNLGGGSADITKKVTGAAKKTSDTSYTVECLLPWKLILDDISTVSYGDVDLKVSEVAKSGVFSKSMVMYMDRAIATEETMIFSTQELEEGQVFTLARSVTVPLIHADGNDRNTGGESIRSYGIWMMTADENGVAPDFPTDTVTPGYEEETEDETEDAAGETNAAVNNNNKKDEVEETEPEETERQIGDVDTVLKTDKGGNTGLIIGIAAGAVVVVAAVVVVLVVVKKKKN